MGESHNAPAADGTSKVHENKVRRAAARQGFVLRKSRSRDHRAVGYGRYTLTDLSGRDVITPTASPWTYPWELVQVQAWLETRTLPTVSAPSAARLLFDRVHRARSDA